jgi:3-oxoadipate enol-lactonase
MSPVALHSVVDGPDGAPVLVLGSSIGTSTALWEPQVPALARRFRVVRYDHRGHGRSPVPPGPYELADLGGDVVALLDRLGVQRAHLGGLSLGGMVAMWVAAHAPERVDRLALVCTSAKLGPPALWAGRAAAVRTGGMAAIAEPVVARWFPHGYPDDAMVDRMREVLLATPPEGYAACCAAIEVMDLEPVLPTIAAPTLVIAGGEDPATPPEHAERIAAAVPGARLAIVDGAAHLANLSHPEELTRLLRSFLDESREER